jgi:glutaredoxin
VRPETEDFLSRIVTSVLGACLLAALAGAAYVWRLQRSLELDGGAVAMSRWTEVPSADTRPSGTAVSAAPSTPLPAPSASHGEAVTTHTGPLPPLTPASGAGTVRIVMYSAPWCYVCDRARDFLVADVVELVELDVESSPAAGRALASKNPMQTLPTFVIQGETLVGFSPYALEHAVRAALSPSEPETGLLAAKRDTAERAP